MKTITTTGTYKAPNGQDVQYQYSYPSFDSLQDAIANLKGGEATALKQVQRMEKVDSNNTAREKARVENGHSTRKPQTEEEKAKAKAARQINAALLAKLASAGVKDLDDLTEYLNK